MRKSATILFLLWAYSLIAAVPGYVNPILPYDYSDPDIIRVGDTYLMTSSSFNSVPGLQILVSKDLVHWSIEDAAINVKTETGYMLNIAIHSPAYGQMGCYCGIILNCQRRMIVAPM